MLFRSDFQDYHFETRHKVEFLWHQKNKRKSALAELSFKRWEESGPGPEPGLDIVWA